MTALVLALGWRPTWIGRLRLVGAVVAATGIFLLLGDFLITVWHVPALLVQAASWGIWLCWLGVVFPRRHARKVRVASGQAYRNAFLSEILPGIACSFAQLLRPAFEGVAREAPLSNGVLILPGVLLVAGGVILIVLGARALGLARTLFVHEYLASEASSVITTDGIYAYIRHPLFVGGIATSMGLALCVGTRQAIWLAGLNVCCLPAYVFLEDRRCSKIVGSEYVNYRRVVGAVMPKVR